MEDLAALLRKYEEIIRLRLADEEPAPVDPRRAMALLASEFPGALREADRLPMDELQSRVTALRGAINGGPIDAWMVVVAQFHRLTRGALSTKRWLAGRRHVDDATRAAFGREARHLMYPADALAWTEDLTRLASPSRGRLLDVVLQRMARELKLDSATLRSHLGMKAQPDLRLD